MKGMITCDGIGDRFVSFAHLLHIEKSLLRIHRIGKGSLREPIP